MSATNTSPVVSTANPWGWERPVNAKVVCTPPVVRSTTRLFVRSTTKRFPDPSTATPLGPVSPVSGTVDCTPPGVRSSTRLLAGSATNTSPAASTAIPVGTFRLAPISVCCVPNPGVGRGHRRPDGQGQRADWPWSPCWWP